MRKSQAANSLAKFRGLIILTPILIATIWLFISNELILYVHPRYLIFTLICASAGVVVTCLALWFSASGSPAQDQEKVGWSSWLGFILSTIISVSMLVIAPTTLSSQFAQQREVNNSSISVLSDELRESDWKGFSIKDWASVLSSSDSFNFESKEVDLTGFIVPIDENRFYLSRFTIYCCAVDAQPVGVPVNRPGWQQEFSSGDWVQVRGSFQPNPLDLSYPAVLEPISVEPISEPEEPYDY